MYLVFKMINTACGRLSKNYCSGNHNLMNLVIGLLAVLVLVLAANVPVLADSLDSWS